MRSGYTKLRKFYGWGEKAFKTFFLSAGRIEWVIKTPGKYIIEHAQSVPLLFCRGNPLARKITFTLWFTGNVYSHKTVHSVSTFLVYIDINLYTRIYRVFSE